MYETSDEELLAGVLAGALAGDQMAFATLVTRYHAALLGYLYRLVGGDRVLAEDLVQKTLLRVLRQGRCPSDFRFKPGCTRLRPIWRATTLTPLACADASAGVGQRRRRYDGSPTVLLARKHAP